MQPVLFGRFRNKSQSNTIYSQNRYEYTPVCEIALSALARKLTSTSDTALRQRHGHDPRPRSVAAATGASKSSPGGGARECALSRRSRHPTIYSLVRERRQLKFRDVFQRRVRVRQAEMPSTQAVVLAALKACLSTEFWIRGELMVDFVHAALGDQLSQDAVGLKLLVMANVARAVA